VWQIAAAQRVPGWRAMASEPVHNLRGGDAYENLTAAAKAVTECISISGPAFPGRRLYLEEPTGRLFSGGALVND
jgi:hypothetical protein